MELTRQKFQFGSLRKVARKCGPPVWEFRYRDPSSPVRPQRQLSLNTTKYPTEAHAWRALQGFLLTLNSDNPERARPILEFGAVIDRFIREERLVELSRQRPGQIDDEGLQYGTACAYLTILNRHIRPAWELTPLERVRPAAVQEWLKAMDAAPKYKARIKALMHRLFEKAMLWDLLEIQRNPMELVEIRGISKRRKKPFILTMEQYSAVIEQLEEPYRTMAVVAQCTGLRASEILALKWEDVDFEALTLRVCRKVVNGRVSRVKTEYSEDDLPLDPEFATVLLRWQALCPRSSEGWMFPNPTSGRPYYASEIQKSRLAEAGKAIELTVKGEPVRLGWHTFRHTYRSWLDATGAPIGVQQKLMRHAQVSTTMDIYGSALMESKREANSRVVQMVLKRAL